jgi:tetratricopeptide (TPR) repeat protein
MRSFASDPKVRRLRALGLPLRRDAVVDHIAEAFDRYLGLAKLTVGTGLSPLNTGKLDLQLMTENRAGTYDDAATDVRDEAWFKRYLELQLALNDAIGRVEASDAIVDPTHSAFKGVEADLRSACVRLTPPPPPAPKTTSKQAHEDCNQAVDRDSRIRGCTHVIDDAGEAAKSMATAHLNRARAWRDNFDDDRAIADYTETIRLTPLNSFAYRNRGLAWRDKKDYDRAIADFTEAIRTDPDSSLNTLLYRDLGLARHAKGDFERAIADFDEAIRRNPRYVAAYVERGIVWHARKDYDRAIADYGVAIKLDPKNAMAHYHRGLARRAKGDTAGGDADIARAREIQPGIGP